MISAASANAAFKASPRCVVARLGTIVLGALTFGAILAAPAMPALAQENLRGSLNSYSRWDGPYFGITANQSSAHADFGTGSSDLIAYILRNTVIENEAQVSTWSTAAPATSNGHGFGGFIGYNIQIEPKLMVGAEANYTKFSPDLTVASTDTLSRTYNESNGYQAAVGLNTSNSITFKDYATVRGRAGYVMGQFMPYGFLGLAVARVDVNRSATVSLTETDVSGQGRPTLTLIPNPTTQTDNRSMMAYGFAAGIGIEAVILPNLFLRAEYEYVAYAPIAGTRVQMQTGRIGIGVKF